MPRPEEPRGGAVAWKGGTLNYEVPSPELNAEKCGTTYPYVYFRALRHFLRQTPYIRCMEDSIQGVSDDSEPGSENERREKLFRLRNRLARQPGDLELIEEYVGLVLDSTSQEDGAEDLETYDRLEGFLLSRAEDVEPEEIDALLEMANNLDERRERVLRQSEPDVQSSETDQKAVDAYEKRGKDGIDTTVPENPEEAEQKLSLSKAVQALIRDQDREPLDGLSNLIERLQVATQADTSLRRAKQIIESAREESDSSQAAYILQSAEQAIQQLVMKRSDLGSARREKIQETVQELERVSGKITKARRSEEDRRRWERFLDGHGEDLEELESWDPHGEEKQFREKFQSVSDGEDGSTKLSMAKTRKEPRRNILTKKIARLKDLLQTMSSVTDEMSTSSGQEKARKKIESLSQTLEAAQQKREQVYNEFALARIRKCFSKAEGETGAWDDKAGIADQLVKYLAEVDQRFLTSEVGRSYSEVFEHLYGKLKRAKSDDDFEEEGRKLNVLKRMNETEVIGIESF